jgi:ribosomal protein S18 acetylase RimI-like enzyme
MLANAFDTNPLHQAIFKNSATRAKASRAIFTAMLKDGIRFGRVLCAYKPALVGILVWYPPGAYPLSPSRHIRLTPHYLRAAAVDFAGLMKFVRVLTMLKRLHPKEPHCYCCCLGVAPGFQGQRIAWSLAIHLYREAQRMRIPIYGETVQQSHVHWYRRLGGWVIHKSLELFPGAPPICTMCGEAHQSSADC